MPKKHDLDGKVDAERIREIQEYEAADDLIAIQERQIRRRIGKLVQEKHAPRKDWLIWSTDGEMSGRTGPQNEWLAERLAKAFKIIPNGYYKDVVARVINGELEPDKETCPGIISFKSSEHHAILAIPTVGFIAFHAPSENMRTAFQKSGLTASWNWEFEGIVASKDIESPSGNGEQASISSKTLEEIRERYGTGEGSTICIIDSGIDETLKEFEGRITAAWTIHIRDGGLSYNVDYSSGNDEMGHGTQVASIAAGAEYGVAKDANIIAIKIPYQLTASGLSYRMLALGAAFGVLGAEDNSAGIEGIPVREVIDTLLVPNGIPQSTLSKPYNKQLVKSVYRGLSAFHEVDNILVVAAAGNVAGEVNFPATEAKVVSVGALTASHERWESSGYHFDAVEGTNLPTTHLPGCDVACVGLGGNTCYPSGTSMASARAAGIVTALCSKTRIAEERRRSIIEESEVSEDVNGQLRILT